jgi:nucleoside-diphosphate-sugar epimerase
VAPGGAILETIRKRQFPIVGDGAGVWSFAHVADIASATAAAIERGAPGVYNVCDDEPAPVAVWLPELASATRIRGASNAKAKRELGWEPKYATWRDGFRHGLANTAAQATVPLSSRPAP